MLNDSPDAVSIHFAFILAINNPCQKFFPSAYTIVDRILDRKGKKYFVKWKKLPYDECTWEELQEEDEDLVEQYIKGEP